MAHSTPFSDVQLDAQGRLAIPHALGKAVTLSQVDPLVTRQVGDSLVLERREAIESRLWAMFKEIPPEVSLVDELVAERSAAAQTENKA